MKKGLIVLLIFILVVGAFFVGTGVNFKSSVETTTDNTSETRDTSETTGFEDVSYQVPDTNTNVVENPEPEMSYPASAFNRIGRDCDTLLEIVDWHIGVPGESWSHVLIKNANRQGYYLESPYAIEINTWSKWKIDNALIYQPDYVTLWSDDPDDRVPFYFYDDYTLVLGESDNEARIIVEEVIDVNENGSIIRTKIDRYGFDNDEYDVYFFVTSLQKLLSFKTDDVGDSVYTYGGDYCGLSEKQIYFE